LAEEKNEQEVALIDKDIVKESIVYSEKCKLCNLPDDIKEKLEEDFQLGALTYVQLCEKFNSELKELGVDTIINPVNISTHFKNHFDLAGMKDLESVKENTQQVMGELAIKDDHQNGDFNGKNIIEIIGDGSDEIKPISKAILQSKAVRIRKLYEQLSRDEAISGGIQNIKVHKEIEVVEDSMFKIIAVLKRDFYLDDNGKYDKSLFVVQDLATRIFQVLSELEIKHNGESSKMETITEVKAQLADLFDKYQDEVDTIKPE
jgi:hypothetical protein